MADVKVERRHRELLFDSLGWCPQDKGERDWVETGNGVIGRSVDTKVLPQELERLAGAFAAAESAGRQEAEGRLRDLEAAFWLKAEGEGMAGNISRESLWGEAAHMVAAALSPPSKPGAR